MRPGKSAARRSVKKREMNETVKIVARSKFSAVCVNLTKN
jgi:hypothetical protein